MSKIIKCKTCSKEIASSAKKCPNCGGKNKKPIYKRSWFIALVLIGVFGAMSGSGSDDSSTSSNGTTITNSGTTVVEQQTTQDQNTKEEVSVDDNVPTEYKTALRKAKSYSDNMNMSKAGVYDQLTSEYGEKFTAEEAQYAIDNLQ